MSRNASNLGELYPSYRRTIVVDFDGTIARWNWPETGEPEPGVAVALGKLRSMGFQIVVSSCRTNADLNGPLEARAQVEIIRDYLKAYGIPFDCVDNGKQGKVVADYYIDDRGLEYNPKQGMNWNYIVNRIGVEFNDNDASKQSENKEVVYE